MGFCIYYVKYYTSYSYKAIRCRNRYHFFNGGSIRTASPDLVVQEHDQLYFAINGTETAQLRDQLANPPKTEV